ncbi:hypothetical protein FQN53_006886 [Emmonsiellopsis sp. PD_33]|nr:hypothetical protein FQN53_006886 [Emmonsiellopsis sp. PD_33]
MSEPSDATSGKPSSAQDAVETDTTTTQPIVKDMANETSHKPDKGKGRATPEIKITPPQEDPEDAEMAEDITTSQPASDMTSKTSRRPDKGKGRATPEITPLHEDPEDAEVAEDITISQPASDMASRTSHRVDKGKGRANPEITPLNEGPTDAANTATSQPTLVTDMIYKTTYVPDDSSEEETLGIVPKNVDPSDPAPAYERPQNNDSINNSGSVRAPKGGMPPSSSSGLTRLAWNKRRIFIVLQLPETTNRIPIVPTAGVFAWRIVITPKSHAEEDHRFNIKYGLLTFSCRDSEDCNGIPKFEHLPLGMGGLNRLAAMVLIAKIPPKVTLQEIKALLQQVPTGSTPNGLGWVMQAVTSLQRAGLVKPYSSHTLERFVAVLAFEHVSFTPNDTPKIGDCLEAPLLTEWGKRMAALPDWWRISAHRMGQFGKRDKMDAQKWEDERRVQMGQRRLPLVQLP